MGSINFSVSDSVATIVLDNTAVRNAVDAPMRQGLKDAYAQVDGRDDIRVAIIRGAGDQAFSSGGYIDAYHEANAFGPDGGGPPPIPRPVGLRKPIIAAIQGFAVGGGFALALACDLRVVGRGAQLGPSGLLRGAVQGAGQSVRLPRLIGTSKALELLLLSRYVSGVEAAQIGLANAAVADDDVMDTALSWATTIAGFSPWAVAETKRLVHETAHLELGQALAVEAEVALEGYRRPEALEGFTAFTERRGERP